MGLPAFLGFPRRRRGTPPHSQALWGGWAALSSWTRVDTDMERLRSLHHGMALG